MSSILKGAHFDFRYFFLLILSIKKVLGKFDQKLQNDPFDMKISNFGVWKVLVSNIAFDFVLYIYFHWGKCFIDRNSAKSKNGLFDSRSFKSSVEILKLLLIFILSYYFWQVFASESHCYFDDMYLLVMWSLKCLKYIRLGFSVTFQWAGSSPIVSIC